MALHFKFLSTSEPSGTDHKYAFSAPLNRVWNAPVSRHSGANVSNAAVSGPR
jgi:hypothetical protein